MGKVLFYGLGEFAQSYLGYCLSQGLTDMDITDSEQKFWGAAIKYNNITKKIINPNNISWDEYDLAVIVSDSDEYCENAINQLTTTYNVPREKIKVLSEVIAITKSMKGFYKWKDGAFDNITRDIVTKEELKTMLDADSLNDMEKFFLMEQHRIIFKWLHYFDAYDRFLSRFRGKDVTILEIGVFKGGSLQMWKNYLKTGSNNVKIYGIDINPDCKRLEEEGITVFIGSQEDREFLRKVKNEIGKVDVLIDDGGHTMNQQIVTFEELFDLVADDGLYLCEDLHTSYWEDFGGGYKGETFIEYSKDLIDYINAVHSRTYKLRKNKYTDSIGYITYCDSMMFIEKKPMPERDAIQC